MSRVVQMEDASGFPVAVKKWEKTGIQANKAHWEHEMLTLFQGEGVPKVVRLFEDVHFVYVATEWLTGMTLEEYVTDAGGCLKASEATRIAGKIISVLKRMHEEGGGYVFTDLKPANIMICDEDVYLVDFESVIPTGMVPINADARTVVMGSRPFTAPELFAGHVSPACDYYSLGVVFYYMITGRVWNGAEIELKELSVSAFLSKLVDPNPEMRIEGIKLFNEVIGEMPATNSGVEKIREEMPELFVKKPKVILIDDNPRFAVELASVASRDMELKVMITAERRDILQMILRELDGRKKAGVPDERIKFSDEATDNAGKPRGFVSVSWTRNLVVNLFDYTGCEEEFYTWAKDFSDLIVVCGRLEEQIGKESLDEIIAPCILDKWEVDKCSQKYKKQAQTGSVKPKFVAWEYKEGISMSTNTFTNIFGKGSYLGEIFYDGNRHINENYGRIPYSRAMPDTVRNQYCRILQKLFA